MNGTDDTLVDEIGYHALPERSLKDELEWEGQKETKLFQEEGRKPILGDAFLR